jgi:hypothetical protein
VHPPDEGHDQEDNNSEQEEVVVYDIVIVLVLVLWRVVGEEVLIRLVGITGCECGCSGVGNGGQE